MKLNIQEKGRNSLADARLNEPPSHFMKVGDMMGVVVVGAGSVGMLVASYLAEVADCVTLIVRRAEQAKELRNFGLVRKNMDGTTYKTNVNVADSLESTSKDSLVIIAVKYGQLQDVYHQLQHLHPETPLLFLQNGLAHYDEATLLPQETIAFGSCRFGAERENDFTVNHRGQGILEVAVEKGSATQYELLAQCADISFPIAFVGQAEQMLFEKAVMNCLVNPLTAILKVKNGQLVENPDTIKLLENIYKELLSAFPAQMQHLTFEAVKNLCRQTAGNTSSMLNDLLHGRPTEIDTIVGAVLKRADKSGKQLPRLTTLYFLIKAMEGSGETM